ncbi:MAG: hypothetical protein GX235_12390 [Clostridiales bacterium]|nr:hypothetical protein [Clostridiales bacterium]
MEETDGIIKINGSHEGPKSLKNASEEDMKNTSGEGRDMSLMRCTDTKIKVNGYECYVYDTNVNHTRQRVSAYLLPLSRTTVSVGRCGGQLSQYLDAGTRSAVSRPCDKNKLVSAEDRGK